MIRLFILALFGCSAFAQGLLLNPFILGASGGGPSSLNTNLIAYWKLDETTGSRVDSEPTGTPQDLTAQGQEEDAAGVLGNAVVFRGDIYDPLSPGWLSRADSADLSGGNTDFTIAAWVYFDAAESKIFVGKWGASAADQEYELYYYAGDHHFYFNIGDGTGLTFVQAANAGMPSTDTWYLLIAWHDSVNNEIGISVNAGTADTAAWTTGAADGGAGFAIGADNSDGDNSSSSVPVRIDEAGFWRKVLSPSERTELWRRKTCCPF